jgi:hypothetical protein
LFYNKYVTGLILKLGGQTTKVIDKGSIEYLGPHGLERLLINISRNLSKLNSGVSPTYALYIVSGLAVYMLSTMLYNLNMINTIIILILVISLSLSLSLSFDKLDVVPPKINRYKLLTDRLPLQSVGPDIIYACAHIWELGSITLTNVAHTCEFPNAGADCTKTLVHQYYYQCNKCLATICNRC